RGAASRQALSRQALTAAARRSASERSRAAKKASATKGPAQRRAAARKAARTREAHPEIDPRLVRRAVASPSWTVLSARLGNCNFVGEVSLGSDRLSSLQ